MQPRIFISAVSGELGQTRQLAANVLTRLGYVPVWQDIFGTESGDLRQMLRDKIDSCAGLVHLVGQTYGAEPREVDSEFGRVSYTQYELLYALKKGKKTWLLFTEPGYPPDTPLENLDLPPQGSSANPPEYQSERRDLQAQWRKRLRQDGHLRYKITNPTEFELRLERLKDEFQGMHKSFRAWQRYMVAAMLVLAALGCGILVTQIRNQRDVKQGLSSAQQQNRQSIETASRGTREELKQAVQQSTATVTAQGKRIENALASLKPEDIKTHLRRTIEEAFQRELQECANIREWEKRRDARELAASARDEKLARVDDFLESIARTIQAGEASSEYAELTRILQEQGVDEALKYAASQETDILKRTASLIAAKELEKQRAIRRELGPLVESVRLHYDRNDYSDVVTLSEKLLALDPKSHEVNAFLARSLRRLGNQAARQGTVADAIKYFEKAKLVGQQNLELFPDDWTFQRERAIVLRRLGTMAQEQGKLKLSLSYHQAALQQIEKYSATDPANPAAQCDLIVAHGCIGDVALLQRDHETAHQHFQTALSLARLAAENFPSHREIQVHLARTHSRLGDLATDLADYEQARAHRRDCVAVLKKWTESHPNDLDVRSDLADGYYLLSVISLRLYDADEAWHCGQAHVKIIGELAEADPTGLPNKRDLMIAYGNIGKVLLERGNLSKARFCLEECVVIGKELVEADPSRNQALLDLTISHVALGNLERFEGNYERALDEYGKEIQILEQLIADRVFVEQAKNQLEASQSRCDSVKTAILATGDMDTLLKQPVSEHINLLFMRCEELAHRHRYADVEIAVARLRAIQPQTGVSLYAAAVGQSAALKELLRRPRKLTAEEEAQRDKLTQAVLQGLRDALAAGFEHTEWLREEKLLTPLRKHPEFQKILEQIPPASGAPAAK